MALLRMGPFRQYADTLHDCQMSFDVCGILTDEKRAEIVVDSGFNDKGTLGKSGTTHAVQFWFIGLYFDHNEVRRRLRYNGANVTNF